MNKAVAWVVGTAVVVVVVVGGLSLLGVEILGSDDEPPIHVKNGSLDFEAGQDKSGDEVKSWLWQQEPKDSSEDSPNYSHEPPSFSYHNGAKALYVKVNLTSTGTCSNGITTKGNTVTFGFSDGKSFNLIRAKSGLHDYRTKIRPQNDLAVDKSILRYSGSGYITSIKVGGWSCEPGQGGLMDVAICTSDERSDCK